MYRILAAVGVQAALERAPPVILFQVLHAVGRDREDGVVRSLDQLLLNQVPDGELQVFAWRARELLDVDDECSGLVEVDSSPRVEHFEDSEPRDLFLTVVVLGFGPFLDQAPSLLFLLLVSDVVLRSSLWITQDLIRFGDHPELRGVTGLAVVWMIPLGEQTVDAMHHLWVGVRADLEKFVVVDELVLCHKGLVSNRSGPLPLYRPETSRSSDRRGVPRLTPSRSLQPRAQGARIVDSRCVCGFSGGGSDPTRGTLTW